MYLFKYLYIIYSSFYLFIYLYIYLFTIYLSAYVCMYVFIFLLAIPLLRPGNVTCLIHQTPHAIQ